MPNLNRRLSALEQHFDPPAWKPWHQVLVGVGEDEAEAIARYEAEHGPVGDDNLFLVRFQ